MVQFNNNLPVYSLFFCGVLNSLNTQARNTEAKCEDFKNNLITAKSDFLKPKPAVIKHFSGAVYKITGEPSCNSNRPTVLLPGYVKLLDGELHVPRKYNLVKSGTIKLTIYSTSFNDPLCLNGESQYLALPNTFCRTNLCKFIGKKVCQVLQEPGIHSIKELEKKLKFNTTLELPDPPNLLGISLLDLFSGEFSFGFTIESEGEQILDMKVPTNEEFLQIGVVSDDD